MNVQRVSEIFGRVLETAGVPADADFFQLGGDSLLATRVLSALAREYGVELTLDDLVGAPTPAALAGLIAEKPGPAAMTAGSAPLRPLAPGGPR